MWLLKIRLIQTGLKCLLLEVWILHPDRNVALAVQNAPDIYVGALLDIKHHMGIFFQWPRAQVGHVQLVRIAGRARRRISADVGISLLQCVDEAQCRFSRIFRHVVVDGFIDIPIGLLARYDGFGFHLLLRVLAGFRTRARNPSK